MPVANFELQSAAASLGPCISTYRDIPKPVLAFVCDDPTRAYMYCDALGWTTRGPRAPEALGFAWSDTTHILRGPCTDAQAAGYASCEDDATWSDSWMPAYQRSLAPYLSLTVFSDQSVGGTTATVCWDGANAADVNHLRDSKDPGPPNGTLAVFHSLNPYPETDQHTPEQDPHWPAVSEGKPTIQHL
ncbi:hypothetical protein PENSPDRAFT_102343 [Peniophora sp. CONT]|nr:hypothetical protein PENSPDRAFT_102343 [Peniophora sp. CONT]